MPSKLLKANLLNPRVFLRRAEYDPSLRRGKVTILMATKDESPTIRLAIESTKDFADSYLIVDKNGSTVEAIEEVRDKFDLDISIYVRPDLNLVESWMYGVNKLENRCDWIMLQDGDEIFYNEGPQNIEGLREYMDRPNVVYCSKKVLLYGAFNQTIRGKTIWAPHTFLYHNDGTITEGDHPKSKGLYLKFKHPYIFNCRIKYIGASYDLIPYDENKFYPYPSIVRRQLAGASSDSEDES